MIFSEDATPFVALAVVALMVITAGTFFLLSDINTDKAYKDFCKSHGYHKYSMWALEPNDDNVCFKIKDNKIVERQMGIHNGIVYWKGEGK